MQIGLLVEILEVAVPAALVAATPRRWLRVVIVLWIVLPIIALAGAFGFEWLLNPQVVDPPNTTAHDYLVFGAFLATPWLLACLIGFGIGFALRRLWHPARIRPTPPIDQSPASPTPSPSRERGLIVAAPDPARPVDSQIAPDGTIRVDLAAVEWSNSHWVMSPRVTDVITGRIVLSLFGTDWDAQVDFPAPRRVRLELRRYRHRGDWTVLLDLEADTYQLMSEPGQSNPMPAAKLAGIAEALEAATARADCFFAARPNSAIPTPGPRPNPLAAWRSALLILAGAIFATGALTYFIARSGLSEMHDLTPLPAMPSNAPISSQR